jgi:ribosome maturation factor RimP
MSAVAERVENALSAVVAARGFDLEAVEVQPAGRRRLIRVLVDRDGGVTLDDIAALTGVVSTQLDETDAMGEQPYVLEVSSPGVDRPLTLPRHWRRNAGRKVRITASDGAEVTGRIAANDDETVTLTEPDRALSFDEIAEAHVEVEF